MPGRHILLDASVRDSSVFSPENLLEFLSGMVEKIGAEGFQPPTFERYPDGGVTTGMLVLGSSHVSIHAWEERRFFQMDLFSRQDFDGELSLLYVYERLGVVRASVCEIVRYDEYTPPTILRPRQIFRPVR